MRRIRISHPGRPTRVLALAAVLLAGVAAGPSGAQGRTPLTFEARTIEMQAVLWWARAPGDVDGDGLLDLSLIHI